MDGAKEDLLDIFSVHHLQEIQVRIIGTVFVFYKHQFNWLVIVRNG